MYIYTDKIQNSKNSIFCTAFQSDTRQIAILANSVHFLGQIVSEKGTLSPFHEHQVDSSLDLSHAASQSHVIEVRECKVYKVADFGEVASDPVTCGG